MKNYKKTRLILSMIFIVLFIKEIKCQYSITGVNGSIYVDIMPDIVLNPNPYSGSNAIYNIDINQDGIEDIKIDAYASVSQGYNSKGVNVSALNSFTSFSLGSIDSTFFHADPPCPDQSYIRPILKIYNYGDTIKNGIFVESGYLTYQRTSGPCPSAISNQWLNKTNVCFGVKYQTLADTFYGWVKIDASSQYVTNIKEFSLGIPAISIISESLTKMISVYPNPFNTTTTVQFSKSLNNASILIYNIFGQQIKQINFTGRSITLNRYDFLSGIYYLYLIDDNNIRLTEKIVIVD